MATPSILDIDWARLSRWCLLGTFVMLVWLLAPTAKCSWVAFRDTPIGEVGEEEMPGQADQQRVEQGTGFFPRWGRAIKGCYAQTPLLGQERWKGGLLIGFAALWLFGKLMGRWERRKKSTFADRR